MEHIEFPIINKPARYNRRQWKKFLKDILNNLQKRKESEFICNILPEIGRTIKTKERVQKEISKSLQWHDTLGAYLCNCEGQHIHFETFKYGRNRNLWIEYLLKNL